MKNTLLRVARRRKGWNQQQLADLSGLSLSTIERAERGESIRADNIERLCQCLQQTPEQLGLLNSQERDRGAPEDYELKLPTVSFEPLPSLLSPRLGYSYLQRNVGKRMTLRTAKYLTLTTDELFKRYAEEEPLRIKARDLEWSLPQVCIFDNSTHHLPLNAIVAQLDPDNPDYSIPTKIEAKAKDIWEEVAHFFHDSPTIRLNQVSQEPKRLTLTVSKAHYLDYIATNYAMDALLAERGWTKSIRDVVHPDKRLEPLETSLLANHIGIGVLVFTVDNYLILPLRSHEKIGIWHSQLSPSISGAANYDEDMSAGTGPITAWMREGREELGIENSDFEGTDIFLGITRELLRGGKPEFFCATRLNLTRAKVEQKFEKARDRWENKELKWFEFTSPLTPPTTEDTRFIFLHEFLHLIEQFSSILAQPMQANLALWFKYMMSF